MALDPAAKPRLFKRDREYPSVQQKLICSPAMGFSADTLRDRIAIVTGAGQGIGRAIAVELARVGAHVVACSRRLAPVEAVAGEVRAQGRRALALACDVGDGRQVDDVVARTVGEFGRIDLLVNNAGYRIRSPLEDLPRDEWDAMVRTNLTGVTRSLGAEWPSTGSSSTRWRPGRRRRRACWRSGRRRR
jgi:NAD(P)-dependent dehydrogenase (short-subunit alcohol dehydrogenase family)